jgi:hypothetical protein
MRATCPAHLSRLDLTCLMISETRFDYTFVQPARRPYSLVASTFNDALSSSDYTVPNDNGKEMGEVVVT